MALQIDTNKIVIAPYEVWRADPGTPPPEFEDDLAALVLMTW